MVKKIKLYAVLVSIACVLVVVLQNTQAVETRLLFFTIVMPRAVLLGITLLIGLFVGFLSALMMSDRSSGPGK